MIKLLHSRSPLSRGKLTALTLTSLAFASEVALAQDDHANTVGNSSTEIAPNSTTSGFLTSNDFDIFRVDLPEEGTFVCNTTGSTDTFGFLVRLTNGRIEIIQRNDDSGVGRNFFITDELPAGRYYVAVRGYSSRVTGDFDLVTSFTPTETDPLPAGEPVIRLTGADGSMLLDGAQSTSAADGTDFGEVDLSAGSQSSTFTVANTGDAALQLSSVTLSGVDTTPFSTSGGSGLVQAGGFATFTVSFNPIEAEAYEATVTLESDNAEDFSFIVSGVGVAAAVEDDHGNSSATASPLNPTTSGNLDFAGDVDAFTFSLSGGRDVTIFSAGSTDTFGTLLSSTGATLASNDDGGSGANFSLSDRLVAGTYTLLVRGSDAADTGAYDLTFTQAEVEPDPDSGNLTDAEIILGLVNEIRAERGLTILTLNPLLTEAARGHTQDMVDNNFLDHTGSDGSTVGQRLTRVGYNWNAWAENIAQGQRSAEAVHQAWVNSPNHFQNIVNVNVTEMGLARIGNTWTQVFGRSR